LGEGSIGFLRKMLENCKEFKQRVPSPNHDIYKNIELFFGEGGFFYLLFKYFLKKPVEPSAP
jgi:hypothetical protein